MARTDTLGNFLTDVATAIKNKKGTTNVINASNFDTEIESIEASTSSGSTPEKGFVVTKWTDDGYAEEVEVVGLTSLPEYSFSGYSPTNSSLLSKKVTKVVLPSNLTEMGTYCFTQNSKLVNVNLVDTVLTNINNHCFYYCSSLNIKQLPDTVEIIYVDSFSYCTSLVQLSMNGVTQIYGSGSSYVAFKNCTNLKAVWIGDSLTNLQRYSFYGCSSLTKIYINLPRATVETLTGYSYAFMNNANNIGIVVCNDDEGFISKEEFDSIDWSTYTEASE